MEGCTSGEEDYYSSDRDSLDGLDNEESDSQWVPPKGPSSKVQYSSIQQLIIGVCFDFAGRILWSTIS